MMMELEDRAKFMAQLAAKMGTEKYRVDGGDLEADTNGNIAMGSREGCQEGESFCPRRGNGCNGRDAKEESASSSPPAAS